MPFGYKSVPSVGHKATANRLQTFAAMSELEHALEEGIVILHTPIKAIYRTKDKNGDLIRQKVKTTVGRMLLANIFPKHYKLPFEIIQNSRNPQCATIYADLQIINKIEIKIKI